MTQETWNTLKEIYDQAGEMVEKMTIILESDNLLEDDNESIRWARGYATDIQGYLSNIIENPENSISK